MLSMQRPCFDSLREPLAAGLSACNSADREFGSLPSGDRASEVVAGTVARRPRDKYSDRLRAIDDLDSFLQQVRIVLAPAPHASRGNDSPSLVASLHGGAWGMVGR